MLFNINSDTNKNLLAKPLWFLDNFINNLFPNLYVDKNIRIKNFNINENFNSNNFSSYLTPSRTLCNHFWNSINWNLIANKLGNINILDIGCGSGLYGTHIDKLISNGFDNYLGVDAFENKAWSHYDKDERFKFLKLDASSIEKYYKDQNIIISQSALEHFSFDQELLKKISQITIENKKPLIEIHLVPSSPCLYTYLWHGYRQYTPRSLSNITRTLSFDECQVFMLGNSKCNNVHFKWITIPEILNKLKLLKMANPKFTEIKNYVKERNDSIKLGKNFNKPSFIGIVLFHNIKIDNLLIN